MILITDRPSFANSITEASLRQAEGEFRNLQRVISQFGSEDFGICLKCKLPIPAGRILTRPESLFCANGAQQQLFLETQIIIGIIFNYCNENYFIHLQSRMKQKTNKIGAVLMALVVLISTMSFTMHKRYCNDYLVDITLFSKSESCIIVANNDCCVVSETCCDHEQIVVDGQNELLSKDVNNLQVTKQFFVRNSTNFRLKNFEFKSRNNIQYKDYIPPAMIFNKQVIHQVFII